MNTAQRDRKRQIREHLQILMQLGRADGRFCAAEDRFVRDLGARLGLSEAELENLGAEPLPREPLIPREEARQREQLLDLVEMMLADGRIDPAEREWVREASLRYGFPPRYADDLTEQVISRQRLSHLADLITLACSDGDFSREERRVLLEVARAWGVTADELQRVLTRRETVREAPPLSALERQERLLDLALMAWGDGQIRPAERQFGQEIARRFGLPDHCFDELLERIARMRQEGIPQTQLREELRGWLAEQFQEA